MTREFGPLVWDEIMDAPVCLFFRAEIFEADLFVIREGGFGYGVMNAFLH